MKLSFIILNYKDPNHLRNNLRRLHEMELPFEYEVIVVDNDSKDESAEMVRTLFPNVTLIESGVNCGHPSGNNIGFREATGQYLFMLNPDIVIRDPQEVVKMVQYMDDHNDIAFLGPRLHNPDGTIQNSCYRKYSTFTPIYRRTLLGKLPFAKRDMNRHLMTDFDHNSTIEVEWLLGACMLIRKKAMDEIGMMDQRIFLYFGDYEWCDRAWANGWRVVYYHDVQHIMHYHKRQSHTKRFTIQQLFSYLTRVHIKDWMTYLRIAKESAQSQKTKEQS